MLPIILMFSKKIGQPSQVNALEPQTQLLLTILIFVFQLSENLPSPTYTLVTPMGLQLLNHATPMTALENVLLSHMMILVKDHHSTGKNSAALLIFQAFQNVTVLVFCQLFRLLWSKLLYWIQLQRFLILVSHSWLF